MRSRLVSLVFLGAVALLCSANAFACTCAGEHAPCEEFWQADAVFSGTVVRSGRTTSGEGDLKWEMRLVHLTVDQPIRGMQSTEVDVVTGLGESDCGFEFEMGKRYLVYAYRDQKDKRLETSICTRTRLLSEADEDLAFIRALPTSGANALIYGNVGKRNYYWKEGDSWQTPVSDVQITIEGDHSSYEARSDEKGNFRVEGALPGKYKVKLKLPPGLLNPSGKDESGKTAEDEIEVRAQGCAEANFYLEADTRVRGRVLDAKGNPIAKLNVNLRATPSNRSSSNFLTATTDADGYFEFKLVEPGDYLLGYHILSSGLQEEFAYGRTYLPGVPTRALAKTVSVKEGEALAGLILQMPPPLAQRSVNGFVVWSDGQAARGASVYVSVMEEGEASSFFSVATDAEGRFTLKLLEGLHYKVSAFRESGGKQAQSEYLDLPLNLGEQPLRLVLPIQPRN